MTVISERVWFMFVSFGSRLQDQAPLLIVALTTTVTHSNDANENIVSNLFDTKVLN